MAAHFVKLTHSSGDPVYINADCVAAIHIDFSRIDPLTVVVMDANADCYYLVKESVDTVVDLVIQATL